VPVKARKEAILITGDRLEIEPSETYIVTGNVVVTQGSREVTCERAPTTRRPASPRRSTT
jgi:lipopolysaccharide export system protein LptA